MRRVAITLATVMLVGACGGGGSGGDDAGDSAEWTAAEETCEPATAAQEEEFARAVEFAQCMRDHGIDGLPDPQRSGSGFMLIAYPLTAEEGTELESEREFARCMREHGFERLPDPQLSGDRFILVGVPLTPDSEAWNEAQETCVSGVDAAAAADWEQVVPGRDCQCSDGSEFRFWVREADPEKVVFYLQDGGACWSAETCAPEAGLYNTSAEGPQEESGIFDLADARNPFADHSIVYVPDCTADVHLGNVTTQYTPDLTVHHSGYVNGTAALDHLAETFSDATDVVVIGESAGSVAAPLYAGLVAERLPDAAITVLADGSGSYPDRPAINSLLADAWGLADGQWSIPGMFIQSGRHDPDIVFARHDYAYDETQQEYLELIDVAPPDLLALIDGNETQIERHGVNLLSYIAPGDSHTVLSDGLFYAEEVDGQPLVDWVTSLVEGEPVDDVHCPDCTPG